MVVRCCGGNVRPSSVPRVVRRPLGWDLAPVEVLGLVRSDAHPTALIGAWADGADVISSEPARVRSPPQSLGDVLDSPCAAGAGPGGGEGGQAGRAWQLGAGLADPAFGGGWIGYLGFGFGGEVLPVPPAPGGPRQLPAWWFGHYDHVLRRDQSTGEWLFEALWTAGREEVLERRFEDLSRRARDPAPRARGYSCGAFQLTPPAAEHKAAVSRAVEYIRRGDIFQANICLRRKGSTVLSRPVKGTHRRSPRQRQARRQRAELERSAKNRAENVMIVDLMRSDLSRVCAAGSVAVPRLLGVEPHPGVWHLVSDVRGTLGALAGDGDLIRATFPPGSVTGAPKVRAVEIIHELEATPREIYTGAVGYRSPAAGLELNVAIRTFEFHAGRVWLGSGGGIVADSAADDEYRECLLKAGPLIRAIGGRLGGKPSLRAAGTHAAAGTMARPSLRPRPAAGVFTSLLVADGDTHGLADHVARLDASARQLFGKGLPGTLRDDLAAQLAENPSGRLRITLQPAGGPLRALVEVLPLDQPQAEVSLRPAVVRGGLGG